MGYFGSAGVIAATEIVAISGDYTVTIGLLSGKEEAECNTILNAGKSTTRVIGQGKDAKQETETNLNFAAYQDARLFRGIKAWDLDDEAGHVVALDMAHIQGMPGRDRETIYKALDKFNSPLTEQSLGE